MNNSVGPVALKYSSQTLESVKMLGWDIPAEYSDLVLPHWRQFEEPDQLWHAILAVIYMFLMICSTLGNGIVIGIFAVSKPIRTPSNLFVVNLALFDLLMMLEMPMFIVSSFYRRPLGWHTGCDVYALLGAVSGMGSAINNAAIAFDRYRTIGSPLDGRLSFKQAAVIVLFTWLWATPFSLMPLLRVWNRFVPEGFLTTCSFDYLTDADDTRHFVAAIFAWAYAIPLTLIVVFYYRLFGHVRAHEQMLKAQAKKMNVKSLQANADGNQTSVEIRIAKLAFTIFFLFLCSWTPYATVAMVGAFGNRDLLSPVVTMIPALAAKIISCIDPWIYAINHPRYRKEIQDRMPWLISPDKPKTSVAASTAGDNASVSSAKTVAAKEDA